MNERIENILELPPAKRIGIATLFLGIVIGGYYMLSYRSVAESMAEHQSAVSELNKEIAEKSGIIKNLPIFEKAVADLDVELNLALKELPDKKEIEQLLAKVSDKAREAGLDIKLFQPKLEQLKDFYAEAPVDIEVLGGFHEIATFFDEVGRMERIVNLTQFALLEPKSKEEQTGLKATVTASSYRFLDENERPKTDEKEDKKRRGRKSSGNKKKKGE